MSGPEEWRSQDRTRKGQVLHRIRPIDLLHSFFFLSTSRRRVTKSERRAAGGTEQPLKTGLVPRGIGRVLPLMSPGPRFARTSSFTSLQHSPDTPCQCDRSAFSSKEQGPAGSGRLGALRSEVKEETPAAGWGRGTGAEQSAQSARSTTDPRAASYLQPPSPRMNAAQQKGANPPGLAPSLDIQSLPRLSACSNRLARP